MAGLMGQALGDAYVNIMAETSALQAGLMKAQGMTRAFTTTAGLGIARGLTMALVGIPALIGGAVVYGIKKFMEAEAVSVRLASAISMVGDKAAASMPKLTKLANQIAMKTKWDDESVKSAMASGAALGFNTKQIEQAMPAVVGLAARLNVGLGGAMRLAVRASQGHTMMLQRYGIQLRQNMTDEQKYQAVLKYGREGLKIAGAEVNTLSGAFGQMRKSIGEAFESFGRGVIQSSELTEAIKGVTDWIWKLKEKIDALIETGQFRIWVDTVVGGFKFVWAQIMTGFKLVGAIISGIYSPWKSLWTYMVESVKAAALAIWGILKNLWGNVQEVGQGIYRFITTGEGGKFKFKGILEGVDVGAIYEKAQDALGKIKVPSLQEIISQVGANVENVLAEYQRRIDAISKSLIGIRKEAALPVSPKVGMREAMSEKADVSIISMADVWKKMQEEAVKKKQDEKMRDLAERQLEVQQKSERHLAEIAEVRAFHPIYGCAG